MASTVVTIPAHTTASLPRPHILYSVHIKDGEASTVIQRRYSEFATLKAALGDAFTLPPKRILSTSFFPSAWLDDALVAERKAGLASYLAAVLAAGPQFKGHPALKSFLGLGTPETRSFNPEDAVPSTVTRKAALAIGFNDDEVEVEASLPRFASYYPENIVFGKYDIVFFAFAMPNSSSTLTWDDGGQAMLQRLVNAAKASGKSTKVVLSIGGWTGCYWYSQAVSTSANRTKFVNAIVSAINTYGLAGVDLDWEYPNSEGAGNPHSSSDAANLLSLVTSLRSALGSSAIISAAVPHLPWLGANGDPLTDVSKYAAQMTYVNIMCVGIINSIHRFSSYDLCGTSAIPYASAMAAFKQWTAAGFPASKLMLGLPTYGYVSQSTRTGLSGSFAPDASENAKITPPSEEMQKGAIPHPRDKEVYKKARTEANLQGWYDQQIPFVEIVKSGALVKKSDGTYGQGGGFTMATVVTYDDTYSLADKAKLVVDKGMAGA
ncbi:glycoside hydrolase [Auriculariales sp. MPI-PUGE-AT-0066]|nr:glycoside hydrolase [Auriculariales sp. MPI-PUGE-AT-0066]